MSHTMNRRYFEIADRTLLSAGRCGGGVRGIAQLVLVAGSLLALPLVAAGQLATNNGQPLPTGAVPGAATGGNSSQDQLQGVAVVPTQEGAVKPARVLRNAAISLDEVAKAPRPRRSVTTPGLVYGRLPANMPVNPVAVASGQKTSKVTTPEADFETPLEKTPLVSGALPVISPVVSGADQGGTAVMPFAEGMAAISAGNGFDVSGAALAYVDPALIDSLPPTMGVETQLLGSSFVNEVAGNVATGEVPSWLAQPAGQQPESTMPVLTAVSTAPVKDAEGVRPVESLVVSGLPATPVNPALDDAPVVPAVALIPAVAGPIVEMPSLPVPGAASPVVATAPAIELAPVEERRVAVVDLIDTIPEPLAQGQTRPAAIEIGPKPTVPAVTELRTPAVADLTGMPTNKIEPAVDVTPVVVPMPAPVPTQVPAPVEPARVVPEVPVAPAATVEPVTTLVPTV
jgi:hypothetical protein